MISENYLIISTYTKNTNFKTIANNRIIGKIIKSKQYQHRFHNVSIIREIKWTKTGGKNKKGTHQLSGGSCSTTYIIAAVEYLKVRLFKYGKDSGKWNLIPYSQLQYNNFKIAHLNWNYYEIIILVILRI